MSLDGEILSRNCGASRVYGYEAEEMLGDCILTLVPSDHWESMLQRIDDLKSGKKRDHYEMVHVNKYGQKIDMSIIMSPLKDLEGNVLGASFIGRNIMRRKGEVRADCRRLGLTAIVA
jgi:PAS domain S-box-containing protein